MTEEYSEAEPVHLPDETALALSYFSNNAVIAGSFALAHFMYSDEKCETPTWTPWDVDIWVLNQSVEGYRAIVDTVTKQSRKAGYDCFLNRRFPHVQDLTINVEGDEKSITLSFIHAKGASCVAQLLHSFDMNVCRVAMELVPGTTTYAFRFTEDTKKAIRSGHATSYVPKHVSRKQTMVLAARLLKYQTRGFEVDVAMRTKDDLALTCNIFGGGYPYGYKAPADSSTYVSDEVDEEEEEDTSVYSSGYDITMYGTLAENVKSLMVSIQVAIH